MQKFEIREQVSFTNEGSQLFGVLHRPIGEVKAPVVIFFHGLAGHRVGKHRMYVLLSECLSHVGIASLRFDFRGSGDSEEAFSEMSINGEVSDALKALEFVANHPQLDPSRIGCFGRSFGGAITVSAIHRFKTVKSVALWAPVFNAGQWEEQWEMVQTQKVDKEQRHDLMRINGQLPSMNFYKELFSMNLEKELEGLTEMPLLLIHGEKDPLVDISHSEKYCELRKNALGLTEFIRLPHSDHDFNHPDEKLYAINHTCQWFAKTL